MFNIDFESILDQLSINRPLFHSEADFQFELALAIKKYFDIIAPQENVKVRLEYPFPKETDARNRYIDIVIIRRNGDMIPIELKYKTTCLKGKEPYKYKDEEYDLKDHSARDLGMYDSLLDLSRIEELVLDPDKERFSEGYTIWLTNDSGYWDAEKNKRRARHEIFRIHNGRKLPQKKSLKWLDTKDNGYEEIEEHQNRGPIEFESKYDEIRWEPYSKLEDCKNGEFQYAILTIPPTTHE